MVRSPIGKKIFITTAERNLRLAEGSNFQVMICTLVGAVRRKMSSSS
jgi:hypothetical protein